MDWPGAGTGRSVPPGRWDLLISLPAAVDRVNAASQRISDQW